MKKLIAWILVLTLCMGLFAGCQQAQPEVTDPSTEATQPTEGTQPTEPVDESDIEGINDALEYVVTFYRNEGGMTPKDFTRIGTVPMGTKKYEVVWTTTLGEDLVKPVRGEDGMVTIQIVGEVDTDTPYTLTATITDAAGNSVSHDWEHILPATMDVAAILEEAYALEKGAAMGYEVTLTGKIISVDTAYSPDYKNVTVTIEIPGHEDKPIM